MRMRCVCACVLCMRVCMCVLCVCACVCARAHALRHLFAFHCEKNSSLEMAGSGTTNLWGSTGRRRSCSVHTAKYTPGGTRVCTTLTLTSSHAISIHQHGHTHAHACTPTYLVNNSHPVYVHAPPTKHTTYMHYSHGNAPVLKHEQTILLLKIQ